MTKPGDSERTAKAREQELKAREFREHGEWMTTMPANYPVGESSRWEDRYAAAFAASERQAVIKECAKKLDSMAAKANEIGNKIFETQWIRDCNIVKASILTEAAAAIRSME